MTDSGILHRVTPGAHRVSTTATLGCERAFQQEKARTRRSESLERPRESASEPTDVRREARALVEWSIAQGLRLPEDRDSLSEDLTLLLAADGDWPDLDSDRLEEIFVEHKVAMVLQALGLPQLPESA